MEGGFYNLLILTLMKVNLTSGPRSKSFSQLRFHLCLSVSKRAPDTENQWPLSCLVITYLDNGAAGNEMARGTEGNKLPYEWYWPPAMVHLGTYPYMNISQQLKLTVDTVTAAAIHRFMNSYIL